MSEEDARDDAEEDKIEAFIPRLRDELKLLGQRESYSGDLPCFAHWAIRQISPQLADHAIRNSIFGGTDGPGTRAVWVDPNYRDQRKGIDGKFCVARFRFHQNSDPSSKDLADMLGELAELARLVASGPASKLSSPGLAGVVEAAHKLGLPTRGMLVLDAPIAKGRTEKLVDLANASAQDLPEGYRLDVIDLRQLYDMYLLRLDTHDLPVPPRVQLRIVGPPAAVVGVPERAVTVQVPLSEIYSLVKEHQLALFTKNLRVPVSGSRYNRRIQEVLADSEERRNFWFFNNGITAICHAFRLEPEGAPLPTGLVAEQLQIVNGCQTSMTIYNEGARLLEETQSIGPLEEASVLLRLIQLPSDENLRSSLAQRIARYTNSQTPITGRDLHATDPVQAKFREEMARDWRIFFETKREEWKRRLEQNRTLKQNFMWPHVIRNDDAAQCFLSVWLQLPAFAKSHKRAIFEDDEVYDKVFGIRSSTESLLIPVFLSHLMEEWRQRRNYVKRHRGDGSAHRFSKDKVFAHGDFYLLSSVGVSLKAALRIDDVRQADVLELRRIARNLRMIDEEYGGAFQGSLRRLARSVDSAFDGALRVLYEFCDRVRETDPELDLRTLLVRDTTWGEVYREAGDEIMGLLDANRGLLASEL
jgi:hypothetical protein